MFPKLMDTVLQGIPGVICYIDDLLVSSKDEPAHLETLKKVFQLDKHGFRLKREKCKFMVPFVTYLGHKVDKYRLHYTHEAV